MLKPGSSVRDVPTPEKSMSAFVATSPRETVTCVPPSSLMSLTSYVDPVLAGGRSVTIVYDFAHVRPATEVTPTLQFDWPRTREKVSPKFAFRRPTWTARAGSHSWQAIGLGW